MRYAEAQSLLPGHEEDESETILLVKSVRLGRDGKVLCAERPGADGWRDAKVQSGEQGDDAVERSAASCHCQVLEKSGVLHEKVRRGAETIREIKLAAVAEVVEKADLASQKESLRGGSEECGGSSRITRNQCMKFDSVLCSLFRFLTVGVSSSVEGTSF